MGESFSEFTSAVVAAFFGTLIGEIVNKASCFITNGYSKHTSVAEKIETIKQLIPKINSAIEEAEGRRIKNEHLLQWLKTLIETVYQADYVLETFEYRRLLKLGVRDRNPKNFVQSPYNLAKRVRTSVESVKHLVIGNEEVNELGRVIRKLECAIYDMSEFRKSLEKCEMAIFQTIKNPLYIEENRVFGRQVEMEKITNFLFQPSARDDKRVDILPLLGAEGMGKTTLALHACNNEKVQNHFSLVIFVSVLCMETKSDLVLVLRKLLGKSRCDHSLCKEDCLFRLQALLKHWLKNKRFLIVFDDVLDVNEIAWSLLHDYLSCGKDGSKIIVVSSSKKAVLKFGTIKPIELSGFHKEEYWFFFKEFAFGSANSADHPKLIIIGREIAKRMQGSPLAAKILGKILRENLRANHWYKVLKNIVELKLWLNCSIFDICNLVLELMPGQLQLLRVSYSPYLNGNEIRLDCLEEKLISGFFVDNTESKGTMDLQSKQYRVLFGKTVIPTNSCMYHTFDMEVC
ncbi:hypothetical protein LUZ60_010524 [Juncus effusus]|nr:hypothetical protein LUZ60_010524 [Juncus effusus]